MHLTNYEKETIITYNEAEKTAQVYTCNGALMRKLDGFCADNQDVVKVLEDDYSKTYELPKKWVRVQRPPVYSAEYKQKLAEKAEALRKARTEKKNLLNAHTTVGQGV